MKRLRYFSNSHNLHSLLSHPNPPFHFPIFPSKTLASHEPPLINLFNSNHFHTKSACHLLISSISSTGFSSVCAPASPFAQNLQSLCLYSSTVGKGVLVNFYLLKHRYYGRFLSFSTASGDVLESSTSPGASGSDETDRFGNAGVDEVGPNAASEQVSISDESDRFGSGDIDGIGPNAAETQVLEIIDMIRRGESDLKSKLNTMNVSLSRSSIAPIFHVLNREKLSALCLYDWFRESQPNSCYRRDICSLVIANCGRLDDFGAMRRILKDFRSEQVCLTQMAFWFISASSSKKASVRKVVEALNEVGGSCRASGVLSLIEMLSFKGSFKLAEFVMQMTERKISYYNIMVRENCRRRNFGRAMDMLDEMRQAGCDPDIKTYNYLFSGLSKHYRTAEATKLFEQMLERNCPPDEITYEIFICHSCKVGNFDLATKLFDKMALQGVKPRFTTHAAFVKGYFLMRRYKEAYNYVIDSSVKYSCTSNAVYSLLARLYMKQGNVVIAQNILTEMINKGFKPHFTVYVQVLKGLSKTGRTILAEDLESRFSSL